jgi:hypothetical protein
VEYYFGYRLAENDLLCEDWRSRHQSWTWAAIALSFFREHDIPVAEMRNADALVGNPKHQNGRFCLAKPGELYLVYLPDGGSAEIDLTGIEGAFALSWFNPRQGGALQHHGAEAVQGGKRQNLTAPDAEDWLAVLRAARTD